MQERKVFLHPVKSLVSGLFTLFMLAGTLLISGSAHASAARTPNTQAGGARTASGFVAHTIKIRPITKQLGKVGSMRFATPRVSGAAKVLYPCQSDTNPQPILCYGPGQIEQAYGMQALFQHGTNGAGSTIVIVDAYGNSTIQADLQAFDADWGLPNPTLNVLTPYGTAGEDLGGWDGEIDLDVEYAHAMAPSATIDLVIAYSASDVDLYNALKYAVDQNLGDVISMSFGENEACVDPNLLAAEHQVFQEAANKGISVLASAGDYGSAQFTCDGSSFTTAVSYPASDPLVTALGGTALTADATTGQYLGETAWNEPIFNAAGGGGYSTLFARPDYQAGVTGATPGRAVPDLALNASVDGGVLIYSTDLFSGQIYVSIEGGTSVAAPEFAGIVADSVQLAHHRLGFLNKGLYELGESPLAGVAFNDITSGSNILFESGLAGYTVQRGWDAVTGWGSPKVADLLLPLIAHVHVGDASSL